MSSARRSRSRGRERFKGVCECGDHAWATLSRGFCVLVSPIDAPLITEWAWRIHYKLHRGRPQHYVRGSRGRVIHREIMHPAPGEIVDHANRNTLDNRRANLRICSPAENARNRATQRDKRQSKYKGVFSTPGGKWGAAIYKVDGRQNLGCFDREDEAARSYDVAARAVYGAFASTNQTLGLLP